MSDLFKGLKAVSGAIATKELNSTAEISISFRGEFQMSKGAFVQTLHYWTREAYENRYGYIAIEDDWEHEEESATLDELPIDNVNQFKETLRNSGLRTIADSLGFTEEEKTKAMFSTIQESKGFKKHYGKNAKSWELLTNDEQEMAKLNYAINKYDELDGSHKNRFGITKLDENEEPIKNYVPTLEELVALRDQKNSVK
jgi:hypothetical protein